MTRVDISLLAAPAVVESLDFETTFAALKQDLVERYPACADVIELESEPLAVLLQVIAYSKVNDRARVNDAARSVMLAYASGSDLDHLGAAVDTLRLDGEDDARFRARIQQAMHRVAAAGPANAYKQHALAVSADIIDVDVWSEAPGQVTVSVLARELRPRSALSPAEIVAGETLFGASPNAASAYVLAASDSAILRAVLAALNAEDVRPLTDAVIVRAAVITPFQVDALIEVLRGPDPDLIRTRRLASVRAYLAQEARLAHDVTRAGLIAALVEAGVKNVHLSQPAADIVRGRGELAVCTGITVAAELVDV